MKPYLLFLLLITLIILSCSPVRYNSLALVGKSYTDVHRIFSYDDTLRNDSIIKMYRKSDSLVVLSFIKNTPYEAIFLFENDTCYYERLKIYCSPCADHVVEEILEDKDYNFEVIDPVNYISTKQTNVVMRLKEAIDENGNCNEISIYKLKSDFD